jgi:hypothetical protein
VLKNKIIEICAGRVAPPTRPAFELDFLLQPLDIPVLPETLLRMELCLGGPNVSLREISQIVLGDLGATMHVFRLAGCQQHTGSIPFSRVEDCLSYLGIRECIDGLSKRLAYRSGRRNAVIDAWAHANTIASFCSLWAEMNDDRINPSEAYFVGLFHELGTLPGLLQWDTSPWGHVDEPSVGLWLASRCALPECATEYFASMKAEGVMSGWLKVVDAAHQLANQYATDERPQLKGAFSYR